MGVQLSEPLEKVIVPRGKLLHGFNLGSAGGRQVLPGAVNVFTCCWARWCGLAKLSVGSLGAWLQLARARLAWPAAKPELLGPTKPQCPPLLHDHFVQVKLTRPARQCQR